MEPKMTPSRKKEFQAILAQANKPDTDCGKIGAETSVILKDKQVDSVLLQATSQNIQQQSQTARPATAEDSVTYADFYNMVRETQLHQQPQIVEAPGSLFGRKPLPVKLKGQRSVDPKPFTKALPRPPKMHEKRLYTLPISGPGGSLYHRQKFTIAKGPLKSLTVPPPSAWGYDRRCFNPNQLVDRHTPVQTNSKAIMHSRNDSFLAHKINRENDRVYRRQALNTCSSTIVRSDLDL
jgi:hypothetical protein